MYCINVVEKNILSNYSILKTLKQRPENSKNGLNKRFRDFVMHFDVKIKKNILKIP